ncbi:phage head closure protein [Comamonas jiangduensis]|uniref:phage head closure protein n=1 Tax=Comamonas jiangduensis TaxID=1194168 RepID=UPI0024E0F0C4|nr:phage head closure protein [Comamonas jiangduensis]
MTIAAGDFSHQIHIQRRTGGHDEWNSPNPQGWENITAKPIWANVRHQSGSESIRAGADVSIVRASVRIRWRTGVDAGMRVLHGGQVFDVEAVLPSADRTHIDLVCRLLPIADAPAPEPDPGGGWG